jgi:hypothetical protein
VKAYKFLAKAHAGLTNRYHSGGSAVVFADSSTEAMIKLNDAVPGLDWNKVGPAVEMLEGVHVFQDAGCC